MSAGLAQDKMSLATPHQLRTTPEQWREDVSLLKLGVLDKKSFQDGWKPKINPVELITNTLVNPKNLNTVHPDLLVKDENGIPIRDKNWGNWYRKLTAVRRQSNLRLNVGRDQVQRPVTFGDVGTGSLNGLISTAAGAAPAAQTFTDTGAAFPTATSGAGNAGLQGHYIFVNATTWTSSVYAVILSNTATVLTVDQWYAIPVTGAAGTTPGATRPYFVSNALAPLMWVALSTSTTAAAATDVTRTADGLWGDGTGGGTATEQTANGLLRAFQQVTFPSATNVQNQHTWTYSTSGAVVLGKVIYFNAGSVANPTLVAGNIPLLETLLNATATVNANGDNVQVTWTVTF